jgi:hypothetical protein
MPDFQDDDWQLSMAEDSSNRFDDDPLRSDELVLKEIQQWWFAARRDDTDHDAKLDEHEYSSFYQRIVYAFNHDGDERTNLNVFEAKEAMDDDFQEDAGGDGSVNASDFLDMVFELAKTWAGVINPAAFLAPDLTTVVLGY